MESKQKPSWRRNHQTLPGSCAEPRRRGPAWTDDRCRPDAELRLREQNLRQPPRRRFYGASALAASHTGRTCANVAPRARPWALTLSLQGRRSRCARLFPPLSSRLSFPLPRPLSPFPPSSVPPAGGHFRSAGVRGRLSRPFRPPRGGENGSGACASSVRVHGRVSGAAHLRVAEPRRAAGGDGDDLQREA